jgi:hypothetical protein
MWQCKSSATVTLFLLVVAHYVESLSVLNREFGKPPRKSGRHGDRVGTLDGVLNRVGSDGPAQGSPWSSIIEQPGFGKPLRTHPKARLLMTLGTTCG